MVGKFQKEKEMTFDVSQFQKDVKDKYDSYDLKKNVHIDIGISISLVRKIILYENYHPSIYTFTKVCNWLNTKPNKYFK
jgi:hypothetical protein